MNRRDLPTLLSDLDDLALRCKDAGVTADVMAYLGRARDALYLLAELPITVEAPPAFEPDERPSYTPRNFEARRTATEHFRRSREFTSEALRRLRRDK